MYVLPAFWARFVNSRPIPGEDVPRIFRRRGTCNPTYSGDMEAAAGVVRLGATPGGVVYPGVAYGEGATQDGLFVGPAIGRVGELVRERVTVKLCPSQPLVASLSANDMLVSLSYTIPLGVYGRKVRQASSSFFTMIWPSPVGKPCWSSYTTACRMCKAVWRTRSFSSCQRQCAGIYIYF